jgi:hypothetical protein
MCTVLVIQHHCGQTETKSEGSGRARFVPDAQRLPAVLHGKQKFLKKNKWAKCENEEQTAIEKELRVRIPSFCHKKMSK